MADPTEAEIVQRESGGKPYVGWSGVDLSTAPLDEHGFPIWPGAPGPQGWSHAAGLYQFQPGEWAHYAGPLGIKDFSPGSQKKVYDAARVAEGARPWAASGKDQPEGFYEGAQHLNVHPVPQNETTPDAILGMLMAGPVNIPEQATEQKPDQTLDMLLAGPVGTPQRQGMGDGTGTEPARPVAPLPPAADVVSGARVPEGTGPAAQIPFGPVLYSKLQLAPHADNTGSRPFAAGEYLLNRDPRQGWSSEMSATVKMPDGSWSVVPGLWLDKGQPVHVNEDQAADRAADFEKRSGHRFPRFPNEQAAEQFSVKREQDWQGKEPGSPVPPLYEGSESSVSHILDAMLAGPLKVGEFWRGTGKGLSEPGEELRAELPGMSAPEGIGAMIGRVPGAMIEGAVNTAYRGGEAATGEGPPLTPTEAFNTALMGVGSGVGMEGLGAGPRIGKAIEGLYRTPAQQVARAARRADSGEAQASLRAESGTARRNKAADAAALEQFRKTVSGFVPDFRRYVAEVHAGNPNPAPSAIMDIIDHVEGRGVLKPGTPLHDIATELQKIADRVKGEIQREIPSMPFIDDYYRHLWAEKAGGPPAPRPVGKQGSGASLRQRTIPTIGEGIRAGLTPKYLDPIENVLQYVAGMEDYLAMHRAFNAGRDGGYIQYHAPGSEPEGWVQLKGRWTEVSPQNVNTVMHAYAPPGYAQAWNAYFGQGFRSTEWGARIYDGVLAAKNTMTASLFALSGYHPMAMAQEAAASSVSRAIGAMTEGEQAEALKQLGLGAILGVRAAKDTFGLGKRVEEQYLRQRDFGPEMKEVVDLYERAGGRAAGRGAEWSGSQGENFFKAWRRGRLKAGLAERMGDATRGRAPLTAGLKMLGQVSEEMARVMETVTAPIFDKMIPRLKNAAFHDEMAAWLHANPLATQPEKLAAARHFVDLMDDRFGEMIMDNVFWNKAAKQTLQIMSVSLGWELGSIRSMAKALPDLLRGNGARARYLAGLGTAIMLGNGAYQYFLGAHEPPKSGADLLFPRTGGTTPEGKPERAMLPGFQKDFVGYWHNPAGEFFNKLSFAGRLPMEAVTGKDRYGHDIAPFPQYTPSWFRSWGKHVLDQMTPIPLQQDQLKGSSVGGAQRFMGIRPAPAYVTDQARTDAIETAGRIRALQGEARGIAAHAARTTGERQELQNKLRLIDGEIRGLQQGLQQRQKQRQAEPVQ